MKALVTNRHVLLVHFHFPPDGLVGAQITAKFAKYLPDFGWEPFVLTAKERYYSHLDPSTLEDVKQPHQVRRTIMIPHPRYGYLALKALVSSNGKPSRGGLSAVTKKFAGLRKTIRSLLVLPDDLTGWIPIAVTVGVRMIKRHGITHIFSSGPPMTNHLVACVIKRLTGIRWAACFEDPWTLVKADRVPDIVSTLSLKLEGGLERAVVTNADAVICLNDFHRNAMRAQFSDLPSEKFTTVSNGYDPDDFLRVEEAHPPKDRFVITHTGTFYVNRTPRHVFAAIRQLLARGLIPADQIRLQFIGNCAVAEGEPVERMVAFYNLHGVVDFSPPIPRSEAIRAMYASHLLLVLAHDWVVQIPAKVYEYLRVGRPILALAPEGATSDLIRTSGSGVAVDPYDVDGIAAHIHRSYLEFTEGPLPRVDNPNFIAQFDRRRLTAAFASLLEGLGN